MLDETIDYLEKRKVSFRLNFFRQKFYDNMAVISVLKLSSKLLTLARMFCPF